jgi:hypothetical protein
LRRGARHPANGSAAAALQRIAHEVIAAPGVRDTPASNATSTAAQRGRKVGPSASGSAAYGLCNAYQRAEQNGNAAEKAVAFRNLVNAAGGASKVAAFCAQVPHPGASVPHDHRVVHNVPPGHPAKSASAPSGAASGAPGNSNHRGHAKH